MDRDTRRTRRSLLGSAGAGVGLLLAGCTGPEDEEGSDLPAEEGTGNGQAQEDDDDENGE